MKLAADHPDLQQKLLRRTLGEGSVGAHAFGPFKTELVAELGALGRELGLEGRVDGLLTFPPRGDRGFGYDPIFVAAGMDHTFAEIDPALPLHQAWALPELLSSELAGRRFPVFLMTAFGALALLLASVGFVFSPDQVLSLTFLPLPLLLWGALRFGLRTVSYQLVAVGVVTRGLLLITLPDAAIFVPDAFRGCVTTHVPLATSITV